MAYSPLSDPRKEIRLLRLLPGTASAQIECELLHVPAAATVEYEALSYTWGDPKDLHPGLMLNKCPTLVTKNLHAALCCLRDGKDPRILWIDALSINQQDIPERNSQVLLMRQVYSNAANVLIWLGDERDGSARAMEFLRRAGVEGVTHTDLGGALRFGLQANDEENVEVEVEKETIRALEALLNRPWFTRAWIVQEFLLANNSNRVLLCGMQAIRWSNLELVFRNTPPSTWRRGSADSLLTTDGCIAMMKFQDFDDESMNLLAILEHFRSFNATDPRDKIYRILGLLFESERDLIDPNYDQSVEEVYTTLAKLWIERTKSLAILSSCRFNPLRWNTLNSWVPDWERKVLPAMPKTIYARLADVIKMPPFNTGRLPEVQVAIVNKRLSLTYLRLTAPALCLGTVVEMWPVEFWWKLNRDKPGEGLDSPFLEISLRLYHRFDKKQ